MSLRIMSKQNLIGWPLQMEIEFVGQILAILSELLRCYPTRYRRNLLFAASSGAGKCQYSPHEAGDS